MCIAFVLNMSCLGQEMFCNQAQCLIHSTTNAIIICNIYVIYCKDNKKNNQYARRVLYHGIVNVIWLHNNSYFMAHQISSFLHGLLIWCVVAYEGEITLVFFIWELLPFIVLRSKFFWIFSFITQQIVLICSYMFRWDNSFCIVIVPELLPLVIFLSKFFCG